MSLVESGSARRVGTRGDTLYNVQALRALAVLIVICLHLDTLFRTLGGASPWGGVELFFVISGFIMVYTTIDRPRDPSAFLVNRLVRIVPLYWLFTFFILACAAAAPGLFKNTRPDALDLIRSLLFIPFRKSADGPRPLLYVGWTLNYEMFFYALFAAGLLFRRYSVSLIAITGVLAALTLVGYLPPAKGMLAAFYTQPMVILFGMGIAVGVAAHRWRAPSGDAARPLLVALVMLGAVAVMFGDRLFAARVQTLCIGVGAAAMLYGAILLERLGVRVHNRVLLRIGDASYSIYLSHAFAAAAFAKLFARLPPSPLVQVPGILAGLAICTGLGWLVHVWIERPLTRAARRLAEGRRDSVPRPA